MFGLVNLMKAIMHAVNGEVHGEPLVKNITFT